MSQDLEELIETLESFDLLALLPDPERLAEAIEARESVVQVLQAFDLSSVAEEERARLKPRLAQVIERDKEVSLQVEQARNEASLGLSHLVSGRAVVRGYGAPPEDEGAVTKRIG